MRLVSSVITALFLAASITSLRRSAKHVLRASASLSPSRPSSGS